MNIRVRGGTPVFGGGSLCDGCRRGVIVQGEMDGSRIVHCTMMSDPIPFRVVECTHFLDRSKMTLGEMKTTAWLVDKDVHSGAIGFIRPRDLTREQRQRLDDEVSE